MATLILFSLNVIAGQKAVTPSLSQKKSQQPKIAEAKQVAIQEIRLDSPTLELKLEKEINVPKYSMAEIKTLKNDKEVLISSFNKSEQDRILEKFKDDKRREVLIDTFYKSVYQFLNNNDENCETSFIQRLTDDLEKVSYARTQEEYLDIFKMLRVSSSIDDIFYDILQNLLKDHYAQKEIKLNEKPFTFKDYAKEYKKEDLEFYFNKFQTYPDEITSCSYKEFIRLKETVSTDKDSSSKKYKKTKSAALSAYAHGVITLPTFNKIQFLIEKSTIKDRQVWLSDYFKIIFSAKNKMIPFKRTYNVINLEDENTYSSEKVKRFSTLTRRKILFQKYDESQIILLSQVMKKASQRMGVDPDTKSGIPYLMQEFEITNADGQVENYVERIDLDTQSQFNLARRLLRKDIVALQMMKTFHGVEITYSDLVLASLETGYISLDDIEYVVKYDDLWNPQISKTDRMVNMAFRIAGYGTFFLPPPWNITAGLALTIIEGIVDSKKVDGASNDNPNTFIE